MLEGSVIQVSEQASRKALYQKVRSPFLLALAIFGFSMMTMMMMMMMMMTDFAAFQEG